LLRTQRDNDFGVSLANVYRVPMWKDCSCSALGLPLGDYSHFKTWPILRCWQCWRLQSREFMAGLLVNDGVLRTMWKEVFGV